MRVLAAGAQTQTEARFIEHIGRGKRDDDDDRLEVVHVRENGAEDWNLRKARDRELVADAEDKLVRRLAEDGRVDLGGEEGRERGRKNIDDDAADDLVCLEFDAEQGVQQREHRAADHGKEQRPQKHLRLVSGERAAGYGGHDRRANKRAEAEEALERKVRHAAAFAEDTADRDDEQRQCEGKAVNDDGVHTRSPPSGAELSAVRDSSASCSRAWAA